MKKALIVLPTYNEEGNIEKVIEKIFAQQEKTKIWEIYVLVVDSESKDKTQSIVKTLQKKYKNLFLLSTKKRGLGKAYVEGFSYALEKINPYLFFEMDADLSHDPSLLPSFFEKIEKGADFVIGSRYVKGGSIPKEWGFHRKVFSIFGNIIARFGFMKPKITDWTSGYRAIKAWLVKKAIPYLKNYSGYVFQIAFLDFAIKNGARIEEIPLKFYERKSGVSKINSPQFIFQSLFYIFLNSDFIRFVIVGLLGFLIDFGLLFIFINKLHIPSSLIWLAQVISAEVAIINNFLLNNFWTFSYKKITESFLFAFLKFNFISGGALLIQTILLQLLVNLFGRSLWILYKILIIALVIIPYSYILYNKVIWRK
jgi:dolichol-phosphate mannosyltransferase